MPYLLTKSLRVGKIDESWPLNQIMTKPEMRGHNGDSGVMIHQSFPAVTIWRLNISILIKS